MKATSYLLSCVCGILALTSCPASAQPWSVPVTNKAATPLPAPNWNGATTVLPTPPAAAAPGVEAPPAPRPAAPVTSTVPLPPGVLALDAEQKEYTAKPGEINCPFTFYATNISAGDVAITFIQTSCGCTTAATKLPINLAAGQVTEIPINMNVLGKNGTVIKTVTIHTDKGYKTVMVKSQIPAPQPNAGEMALNRERNQLIAQADRQAVFKGDCARCHVEPVIGKMGKELYTAACGICHEAEHRATMVPDLHALKVTPNAEYWRMFVTMGKPATLMPAFAQAQGGPLSDLQINSLVDYLVKDFPTARTNAPAAVPAH